MTSPPVAIHTSALSKTYTVPERAEGLKSSLQSLFHRRHREVRAVENLSFDIQPGEVVGFLGPNGAGKTTTLKMLSGLLYPTHGSVSVLGHVPSRRERNFLRRIALIMGQRFQLQWDLPAFDSLDVFRAMYEIPVAEYRRTRDELVEILDLQDLIYKPVRNLSLGERMKFEIVAGLVHRPQVLFLDEPTLGLDVTMQRRIRVFVAEYNRRHGATVLLTSHYMADVEALCRRVIVIHQGRLLFDGQLDRLLDRVSAHKTIRVTLADGDADLAAYGEVISRDAPRVVLRVEKSQAPSVTARLLADWPVLDLTVEEPPLEALIERVFAQDGEIEP